MTPTAETESTAAAYSARMAQLEQELQGLNYAISHDLRAPLRAIIGFSQALKVHLTDLDTTGAHLFSRIEQASAQLSTMIDGLLQLSRVAQAELHCIDVDLNALCTRLIDELRQHYPTHAPQVNIAAGLHAHCDPHLMRSALHALLDNAWKFSSDRQDAHISIDATRDSNALTLCVRDNGIGFDMRYVTRLFVPFQHLQTRTELNGPGIGLALVQRIIGRHGGRVWAESTPHSCTAFYCVMPRAA